MDKVIFLDRDGVINVEVNYLSSPSQLQLIHGTKEALKLLKDNGYKIYVVTNQSGIARGYFTEDILNQIHNKLNEMVDNMIDHFFYCPHSPIDLCDCRKPKIGMVNKIGKIDYKNSYLVGDKKIDYLMGRKLGVKTIAALTGYGEIEHADYVCENLLDAVRNVIL